MISPTMAFSDPEDERQRLAQLYADMNEGELQKLLEDEGDLTPSAREALKLELSRRGFTSELVESAVTTKKWELLKLVTLRQFRDLPEALLAKGMLNSAGIECFLGDENIVRMDWFYSNLVGGIKLWVKPEDADGAANLLDQGFLEGFDVEGVGEYKQPRCPNCQSFEISFEELNKPVAFTGVFFGIPIPLKRRGWICHSCGNKWQVSDDTKVR
jgi:hypothetical protein